MAPVITPGILFAEKQVPNISINQYHCQSTRKKKSLSNSGRAVTPQTKVVYLSHITSSTALRLPVEKICERARNAGILSIIDAAHSPGHIPVDLQRLNADVVFGNAHKWMLAPKGAAFLYVRREIQNLINPLIVSWGTNPTPDIVTGSRFIDILQWTGHERSDCRTDCSHCHSIYEGS